jgi:membrane protein
MMPSMTSMPLIKRAFLGNLWALRSWPWADVLKTLRVRFREDRLGLTAGSLTFTTLISLVPLLTVMLAVFSAFPIFSSFQEALQKFFLQSLIPENIAKPVLAALTQFASKANRLGAAGLVVLGLTALALMLTMDRTLNTIWRVPKPRPIAQRVLVYWACITLGPLVLGVSLSLTSYLVSSSRGLVGHLPGGVSFLLAVLEFVVLAGGLAALFHYVPNTHVRWRHAIAGAVFAAIGFELAKRLLAWYLAQVPTYSVLYGAFAAVPIFLVWIYLGWVVVLLGAVVAAYAPSLQFHFKHRTPTAGAGFELAVAVLAELQRARSQAVRGLSTADLSQALNTDPLQLEPVLSQLMSLQWVGRLDEDNNPRHVLLCAPTTTLAQPLLSALLLAPSQGVQSFWQRVGFDQLTLQDLLPEQNQRSKQ